MADLERTIAIIFEGDNRSAAAFSSVTKGLEGVEMAVTSVTGPMAALADGIIKVEGAAAALAIGGLAYAYSKSVEFESAMTELAKVVGADQVEALNRAKVAALELSGAYGISATEIVESIAKFAQAGYSVEDSMLLAENALKLVSVGGVSAAEASNILVRSLKGLGEEAAYSEEILAALNWVSNNFATDVGMLAEALARSAPLAKTYGMSMQEVAGILTPMIEVFQNAEYAATAFKTGLSYLKADTDGVKTADGCSSLSGSSQC